LNVAVAAVIVVVFHKILQCKENLIKNISEKLCGNHKLKDPQYISVAKYKGKGRESLMKKQNFFVAETGFSLFNFPRYVNLM
jgi:hypothetical protein